MKSMFNRRKDSMTGQTVCVCCSRHFTPLTSDLGVFFKGNIYISIYVDDLLIAGPRLDEIASLKAALSERFDMVDLGECHFYLRMQIVRDRPNRTLRLSQSA